MQGGAGPRVRGVCGRASIQPPNAMGVQASKTVGALHFERQERQFIRSLHGQISALIEARTEEGPSGSGPPVGRHSVTVLSAVGRG